MEIWGFLSRGFLPNPGDICEIPGIYIPIPGDFLGIFIPGIFWGWGFFGDGDLFSWDGDIPPKSHLWAPNDFILLLCDVDYSKFWNYKIYSFEHKRFALNEILFYTSRFTLSYQTLKALHLFRYKNLA